jgi:hypothetical protein
MDQELEKLNKEYLLSLGFIKLREMVKKLGKNICKNPKTKVIFTKEELTDIIINHPTYIPKTKMFLEELELEKKKKYYKENLPKRLYGSCTTKENKKYNKPCLLLGDTNERQKCSVNGKNFLAHRVSYALYNNIFIEDIPTKNEIGEALEICHGHNCPKNCIEPTHLSLKTKKENNYDDKIRDINTNRGEKHYKSKITEELAKQIKHSKGNGMTRPERAEFFKVSISIIQDIDYNFTWAYIPDKDGNIEENTVNNRVKERMTKNKQKELSEKDYEECLRKLKDKSDIVQAGYNTPCWLYKEYKNKYGYGVFKCKGIQKSAHIFAYESYIRKKRDTTGDKKLVCHKCNNKSCCNPEHLYLGTAKENIIDSIKVGRKKDKLNEEKVREIKKLLKEKKLTQKEISEKYKVADGMISQINSGKVWGWVN